MRPRTLIVYALMFGTPLALWTLDRFTPFGDLHWIPKVLLSMCVGLVAVLIARAVGNEPDA